MSLPTRDSKYVYLTGYAGKHRIEDALVWVSYTILPAEPDVGILSPYVEIDDLCTLAGRDLNRIWKNLDAAAERFLYDQIT